MDGGYAKNKPGFSRKRKPESFRHLSFRQLDILEKNKRRNIDNESKPIDTLYRMLCPVYKIGSVLGKGGSIVSAIRDETHAKIRVADKFFAADERVIIIYNHPVSEPGHDQNHDPNVNAEEGKHIKPHCPAQAALLKVYDRIVEDEFLYSGDPHKNSQSDDIKVCLLVPNNQVGCLIGKAGDVIQKLRSGTGANIRILGEEHLPPCAMISDALVQISGNSDVVKKALYEISTRLHQHPRKENPPIDILLAARTQGTYPSHISIDPMLPRRTARWLHEESDPNVVPPASLFGGYRNELSRMVDDHDMAEDFSLRVVCSCGKIGSVIGKGGANVRQVEQQTGASIHVENSTPESEIRIILISSKEALWDRVSSTIDAILQLQERVSEISDNGDITTRLLVPSSKAGCILGQGGQVINEMRKQTRADIRVYAKSDKPSYASPNEELVQISGNQRSARDALFEVVSRLRERTLRNGNAAAHYPPAGLSRRFSPYDSSSGISRAPSSGYGHLNIKGHESKFEDETFRARPPVSGYTDFYSPAEATHRSSVNPSVFGGGADSVSDFRQDHGTSAKIYDPLSRSVEYASDIYGPPEQMGSSWKHHGGYEDPRREDPWHSYFSQPYRSFERD